MTVQHPIAQALLAMVPGAQPDATRVTIEHSYAQLDMQSVDSWTGTVDGLACRVAEQLRTTASERDTLAPAGAAFTSDQRSALELPGLLYEAITGFQTTAQLTGLGLPQIRRYLAEHLYLALVGDSAPSLTIYRAEHDTIVAGRYTTSEAAQQHCEALVSREYPASASLFFEWCANESDSAGLELDVCVDDKRLSTGYTVTPLEVAVAYDPDADE